MTNPIQEIKNWYYNKKYERTKHRPNKIDRVRKAKIMDTIIHHCARYYLDREAPEVRLDNIGRVIFETYGIPDIQTNLLINIMTEAGYVKVVESDEGKHVVHTVKGVESYIDGGFLHKVRKEQSKELLILLGQIAAIIGGLHLLSRTLLLFLGDSRGILCFLFCS